MKQVLITKKCRCTPNGAPFSVNVRPGQVMTVSDKDADKMVNGNVAELVEIEKPAPKKAPANKQRKVKATK